MRKVKVFNDNGQGFEEQVKVILISKEDNMSTVITSELREIAGEAIYFHPAISIIMPFEPKMSSKKELTHSLNWAADKAERELLENYPDELVMLMMQKLNAILGNLNFGTHKKSIAIYVTPVFEKILYLDIRVEQKVIVDGLIEIRDIVRFKKQMQRYLVLLLSGKKSEMYLGDSNTFVKIISDSNDAAYIHINQMPEPWMHFYDVAERRKKVLNKWLNRIDNTLDIVLNTYQLPLFVLGTEKMSDDFKNRTKHKNAVIDYVQGYDENTTLQQVQEILAPHIADWKNVVEKDLSNQLQEAADKNKLAVGMEKVWREAMNHNGRLLVIEKNYVYATEHGSIDDIICKAVEPYRKFSYIKNAVDEVIEKVLENGGDVEFVDRGLMMGYNHIAMLQFH